MKIGIYAPEGNGNGLTRDLMRCHPQIEGTGGASLPFNRMGDGIKSKKGKTLKELTGMGMWPQIKDMEQYPYVILVTRDAVHGCYSGYRRFGDMTCGKTPEERVEMTIWHQLAARDMLMMMFSRMGEPKKIIVRYEQLVTDPKKWLDGIAGVLGIERSWDISSVKIENRNDERWKNCPEFVKMWDQYKGVFG